MAFSTLFMFICGLFNSVICSLYSSVVSVISKYTFPSFLCVCVNGISTVKFLVSNRRHHSFEAKKVTVAAGVGGGEGG